MESAPNLNPRKVPTQARALARVVSILDATATLLERQGYDALTTNAIALEAGVNVASLYQYFPNKQAVMAALAARMAEAWLSVFDKFAEAFADAEDWRSCFQSHLEQLFAVDARLVGSGPMRHAMNSDPILRAIDIQNDADVADNLAEGFAKRGRLPLAKARLIAGTITGSLRYLYDSEGPEISPKNTPRLEELAKMHDLYLATYFDPQENVQ